MRLSVRGCWCCLRSVLIERRASISEIARESGCKGAMQTLKYAAFECTPTRVPMPVNDVTDTGDTTPSTASYSAHGPDLRIVLVNPSHPGNIGAAARAMKTMNVTQLVLVEPQDFPDPRAIWRSAGARDVVENARVVEHLDAAIADCDLVIGTSARERRIPWPLVDPRECAEKVIAEPRSARVAILFGREDCGLNNDELQRCHLHVHVPTGDAYRSLNLAMAVQIVCYEIRMASLAQADNTGDAAHVEADQWDAPYASADDVERFHRHLAGVLADLEFFDPDNPKQLLTRLRRLFARVRLDQMELNILRGILSAIEQKIVK